MLSTELHLVSLLEDYVAPKPVVASFVRTQLFRDNVREAIKSAVCLRQVSTDPIIPCDFYQWCLSHSGLDFKSEDPALAEVISSGLLYQHLFDLSLGQQVKASKIRRYSEFYSVRHSLFWFAVQWVNGGLLFPRLNIDHLFWDREYSPELFIHQSWVSPPLLEEYPRFFAVFDSWLEDGSHLQDWLEGYEANTGAANNPYGSDRVLSESVAVKALELAEVRLNAGWA